MLSFNESDIKNKLEKLTHEARIAFAASCCERMLPSYKKFVEIEQWGDYDFLRSTLNEIWIHIYGKKITEDKFKKLMEEVFTLMPDEEDFESIYTTYALEASATVSNTLKYCSTRDLKYLISVVNLSIATVDLFVQEKYDMDSNDSLLEEKITQAPLMQKELKRQLDDLQFLQDQQNFDEDSINMLRSRVEGKSNIEL